MFNVPPSQNIHNAEQAVIYHTSEEFQQTLTSVTMFSSAPFRIKGYKITIEQPRRATLYLLTQRRTAQPTCITRSTPPSRATFQQVSVDTITIVTSFFKFVRHVMNCQKCTQYNSSLNDRTHYCYSEKTYRLHNFTGMIFLVTIHTHYQTGNTFLNICLMSRQSP